MMLLLGLLLTLPLSFGDITVGSVTFSLFSMLVGVVLSTLGLQSIYFGCLAHVFLDYGGRYRERWRRVFSYTKTVSASGVVFTVGLGLVLALVVRFVARGYTLPDASAALIHLGILGLFLMTAGFSTFCFTLLLHATAVSYGHGTRTDV